MARSSTSGQGRPKGVPNKHTRDVKEMILGALQDAGGQEYLARQATENPSAFLSLVGRVVPSEVKSQVSGTIAHQHLGLSEVRERTGRLIGEGANLAPALASVQ